MNKKKLYLMIFMVLACALGTEIAGVHLHQGWPLPFGYDLAFGFVGCWLLIIMAKMIMAPILQKHEDYYDGGEDDE